MPNRSRLAATTVLTAGSTPGGGNGRRVPRAGFGELVSSLEFHEHVGVLRAVHLVLAAGALPVPSGPTQPTPPHPGD
ncbi:hypothetical protein ACFW6V_31475 [Streptomyces sp. NPDC058734]|uniref:hypothetical protein n=1 Tax=Streptomyces sp. NPDC058734 TaxID=3346615 RepID=UPI003681F3FF